MKKALLILLSAACLAACKKKDNVVNNYYTVGSTRPSFVINGVNDLSFINDANYGSSLSLTVEYTDSVQENVTLAVNGLPSGITMDNTWINSGIPTFSTTLSLFDTNAVGVTPGIYPVTLTATTTSGKVKSYPFNLRVAAMPSEFMGKYATCNFACGSTGLYADSIYVDAIVPNKVWFTNFANSGAAVYALISNPEKITIPAQTVGGITYSANAAFISLSQHRISMSVKKGTATCSMIMN